MDEEHAHQRAGEVGPIGQTFRTASPGFAAKRGVGCIVPDEGRDGWMAAEPEGPKKDLAPLFDLVRQAFGQRRKMLRRSLAGVVSPATFDAAGISPTARCS